MMLRELAPTPAELADFCAFPGPDRLSGESVCGHAADMSCLYESQGKIAGRCSLWWRSVPRLDGERTGFIGHYAAIDSDTATGMLSAACERLRLNGCTRVVAPIDGSTWRRYRLVTWRGSDPPYFLEPDNPDDWPRHYEGAGFQPLAHYYSAKCDRLSDYPEDADLARSLSGAGYRMRCIDMDRVEQELALLWSLATAAFANNFLYSPISEAEFREMHAPLIRVLHPQLVSIVEQAGEPAAFAFAIPDMLQAARGEKIDTVILKTIGVRPERRGLGLGNWMTERTFATARRLGFQRAVLSTMHEANPSRKLGRGRTRDMRRYTLYMRAL